jgi:hypothetical protein
MTVEECNRLIDLFRNDEALLPTARTLAESTLAPYQPKPDDDWRNLLTDIGDLPKEKVLLYASRLSQALNEDSGVAAKPTPGLKPNLDAWIDRYANAHGLDLSRLTQGIHWISYVVSPRDKLLERYDVAERYWPTDFAGKSKVQPTKHRLEDVNLEQALAWIESSLTTLRTRIPIQGGHFAFEFFVPVQAFDRKFDRWSDPNDDVLKLGIPLGRKFPVVVRPIDYVNLDDRSSKLEKRAAAKPGIRVLNPLHDVEDLVEVYFTDEDLDHICVCLEAEPPISTKSGSGDLFAAILGLGLPAMFWFRSNPNDAAECAACVGLAQKYLAQTPFPDLPKEVFERRKAAKKTPGEEKWLDAVLVIDLPDRVPRDIRAQ